MFRALVIFFLCGLAVAQAPLLPVGIVPGLGDSCGNPMSMARLVKQIQGAVPNKIFCIDSGPGAKSMLSSFKGQLDTACKIVAAKSDELNLTNGFIIMGLSQGGLIARGVIEYCSMGQYVKKLITLGGPHQGVAQIPHTGQNFFDNIVNKIADWFVYDSWVQNLVGPAGYFHRIDDESTYFNSKVVLADLNNVGPTKNPQYVARMKSLDAVVLIMFAKDTMIIPKETAHFGYYADSDKKTITALEDSKIIKEDLIGMKSLVDAGKVFKHEIDGDHLQFGMDDLQKFVFVYFA